MCRHLGVVPIVPWSPRKGNLVLPLQPNPPRAAQAAAGSSTDRTPSGDHQEWRWDHPKLMAVDLRWLTCLGRAWLEYNSPCFMVRILLITHVNMFSTIDIGFYNLTIKVLMNAIISILGKDIGELNLSNNNLRTIPPDIRRLTQLVKLDLSRNGLRCLHSQDYTGLPAEMSQLISLEIICISECNLPFIPPVIWKLTSLKVNQNIILII